ncbi:MAG TPA: hypothetical protein VLA56_19850, partial [Pseudomonadales bacterium]|nr:hypothetical protein [Pseudomonadales bacterium]
MQPLTPYAQQAVEDIARRYGVSIDAVVTLLVAVNRGGGWQAQFSHRELGGMGQWSRGGMTMVGDMFNNNLKALVANICGELSNQLANNQMFPPPPPPPPQAPYGAQQQSQSSGGQGGSSFSVQGNWSGSRWPAELGQPSSSGSQNNLHYAVFPQTRRLAIDLNGQVTVYDIGDHRIGGFSQQQGGDQSLTFTSQYGLVRVADLPVVPVGGQAQAPQQSNQAPSRQQDFPAPAPTSSQGPGQTIGTDEVFALIEKLYGLHEKG